MNFANGRCIFWKYLKMTLVVVGVTLLSRESKAARLVQTARFSVPKQTQVLNFVATKKFVYASVRYRLRVMGDRKSALVAWDTKGKLLWRVETEEAYQLTLAGTQLVLAYEQDAQYKRGLIWIDPTNGKEIRRIPLSGRPFSPQYFPREKTYILYTYPMDHGQKPTILAYDLRGSLIWSRETYSFLKADNKVLVIRYRDKDNQSVERINPANGATMWKKTWKDPDVTSSRDIESVPIETQYARPALDKLVYVPHDVGSYDGKQKNWGEFLDLATGKTVAKTKWPETTSPTSEYGGYSITPLGRDRLYHRWHDSDGLTISAIDFPSGRQLWAAELNMNIERGPVQWKSFVVFLLGRRFQDRRKPSANEIRIYDHDGRLIVNVPETGDAIWANTVEPQAVGDKLYIAKGGLGKDNHLAAFKLSS